MPTNPETTAAAILKRQGTVPHEFFRDGRGYYAPYMGKILVRCAEKMQPCAAGILLRDGPRPNSPVYCADHTPCAYCGAITAYAQPHTHDCEYDDND